MTFLQAQQLLNKVSSSWQQQRQAFSKAEILQKINQIKYLSEQKNISRFTIKKEILRLEKQLEGISSLEKRLQMSKKQESAKVIALKRQVTSLQSQLSACADPKLPKKVERLSFLLGDLLARRGTMGDVELSRKAMKEMELALRFPVQKKVEIKKFAKKSHSELLEEVQMKLETLKVQAETPEAEHKILLLEEKINQLKVQALSGKQSEEETESHVISSVSESSSTPSDTSAIKHDILFGIPAAKVAEVKEPVEIPHAVFLPVL
ncbi:MAG: hypothetical protein AABY26_02100 [Nanoarchaeota archaeon]